MDDAPAPAPISPTPTPAQAAAIVAAIECFARDTAPPPGARDAPAIGGWERAARLEAVGRSPGSRSGLGGRRPGRAAVRKHSR